MNRDDVSIKKIKIKPGLGAIIVTKNQMSNPKDGASYFDIVSKESPVIVHSDFHTALDSLKPIVAEIHYYKEMMLLGSSNFSKEEKKAFNLLKKHIDREYTQLLQNITISGVALSGNDKTLGVIITGTIKSEIGQKTALNTPRIMLAADSYGFEQELSDMIDAVTDEMYLYLYEKKKAVPDFGLTDENVEKEPEMAKVG